MCNYVYFLLSLHLIYTMLLLPHLYPSLLFEFNLTGYDHPSIMYKYTTVIYRYLYG